MGLSLFFVIGSLVQIAGILVSKPLADRFGKKAVFIAGASVTTLATALVFLAGPTQVGLMFWLSILWAIGWGPTDSAAVGDDRRRGGPLRVADGPARDRLHVRGHPLRAEGRPQPGRRA